MTSLTVFQDRTTESKMVLEYYDILNFLAEKQKVELIWVSGCSGFRSSEIMYELARL